MSGCSLLERISTINMEGAYGKNTSPPRLNHALPPPNINPVGPGPGGGGGGVLPMPPPPPGPVDKSLPNGIIHGMENLMGELCVGPLPPGPPPPPPPLPMQQQQQQQPPPPQAQQAVLEKDYYGCYCLKFIVKNGSHITEEKVVEDFGHFGEVVDVRGPGLFSGLRGNHVYVRFIDKADAEDALRQLSAKYHQLTPASISDVLPDNYGLYTISFYNKTGIPSAEVRKEFSQFGEVKNLTGSLDVKGGRVFVSYKDKTSAVQALQAFFFRKERYPNMKFALPRCEKDYFGCYCLKFYNKSGDVTEEKVNADFGQFGEVVDVRGPGLFDVTGDDVYVRYKEKTSAEQALIELVGKYDSLCLAPPSDIQADKFGYFTITFVNDKCLSKSDVWYIFSKFGTVACVNGTFDCKKGRVFVSYKDKQGALNALETMLITKEYHLQVSKNSTVRKNDYNVVGGNVKDSMESNDLNEFGGLVQPNMNGVINVSRNNSDGAINGKTIMPGSLSSMVAASMQQQQQQHHFLKDATAGMQLAAAAAAAVAAQQQASHHHAPREHSRSRESSLVPPPPPPQASVHHALPRGPSSAQTGISTAALNAAVAAASSSLSASSATSSAAAAAAAAAVAASAAVAPPAAPHHGTAVPPPPPHSGVVAVAGNNVPDHHQQQQNRGNGLVKFNRNVGKDIFGYYCLSFLNEDGDINEKKVRHDFGKFGEVVSVRGALGKQKGHVFVRFRRKESAENCLNCLNSFPLSEMSELFGKYLFLSPATPRDIDCDMYGFYSISFLNLNMNTFHEIRGEFSKFGEIVRLTSGGGGNTDELVSISYKDKSAAVKALQTHFTNKEFPYLDIAKGSSLLLVTSSDSSDNEEGGNEAEAGLRHRNHHHLQQHHRQQRDHRQQHHAMQKMDGSSESQDPFHDPSSSSRQNGHAGSSDVVDELLKPLQSYFNTYRTGQFATLLGGDNGSGADGGIGGGGGLGPLINGVGGDGAQQHHHQRSPDKKYRIKSVKGQSMPSPNSAKSSSAAAAAASHSRTEAAEMRRGGPTHPHPPPPLYLPPPNHNTFSVPPPPTSQQQQPQPQPPPQLPQATADGAVAVASMATTESPSASAPAPSFNAPLATQSPSPSPPLDSDSSQQQQQQQQQPLSLPTSPQESGAARARALGPSSTSRPLSPTCEPDIVTSATATAPESSPNDSELQPEICNGTVKDASETLPEGDVGSLGETETATPSSTEARDPKEDDVVHEDYLGYFSLSFSNRCKDLSERKIRLDISKESGVSPVRVRGLAGLSKSEVGSGEIVTVSFSDKDSAEKAMSTSKAKYPGLRCAPKSTLRPDKDGFFSVEFINCGMSGIREITNEFSRHGEVSKVMAGGGSKNAVKRVTVSFAEKEPALAAVRAHSNSKDFASLDFAKENVFEESEANASAETTCGSSD